MLRRLYLTVVAAIYVLLVLPVVIVILVSVNPQQLLTVNLTAFSLRWYEEFFESRLFFGSFLTSLEIASITAIISTLLAIPAAYALVRVRFRGRDTVQALLLSPIVVPSIILGVALLNFYYAIAVDRSIMTIVLAHVALTAPYVIRTVTASLGGLDSGIEEAAIGLGASPLRTFLLVTLPLMRSGVIAGWIFVFIISFGELEATVFLTSPGATTLPVQIFSELVWTSNPIVAAASVAQIAVIAVAVLVLERVFGITRVTRF